MGNSLVIMDSFALPVQGTETRVNAANEANEYMVKYIEESDKVWIQACPGISRSLLFRPKDWRMPLAGTTHIQAMDAGCRE